MTYTKQNFKDGNVLSAQQLNAIEDGIINATPIKGVDYWTEEDIAEIKAYIDEAILEGVW